MSAPERRLTQRSRAGVIAPRKKPTAPLSSSHQSAEPTKTPQTIRTAEPQSPAVAEPQPGEDRGEGEDGRRVGQRQRQRRAEGAASPRAAPGFASGAG